MTHERNPFSLSLVEPEHATDPVCGMTVDPASAAGQVGEVLPAQGQHLGD